jgi:hypothetical protein
MARTVASASAVAWPARRTAGGAVASARRANAEQDVADERRTPAAPTTLRTPSLTDNAPQESASEASRTKADGHRRCTVKQAKPDGHTEADSSQTDEKPKRARKTGQPPGLAQGVRPQRQRRPLRQATMLTAKAGGSTG